MQMPSRTTAIPFLSIIIAVIGVPRSHAEPTFTQTPPIDWAQPPAACIEELVPQLIPCLDLSRVVNPLADLPSDLTEAQKRFWTIEHKADLSYCRALEVFRREEADPGSMTVSAIAWAWMWRKSAEDLPTKIEAIYEGARASEMPPQILFGALKQESLLSSLGITPDGENYSCGIGQINVKEWCHAISSLSAAERRKLGWPEGMSCDDPALPTHLVKPFYEIAIRKLEGRPDYELTPKHFEGIQLENVIDSFPAASLSLQKKRFAAVSSFVRHCSDIRLGIWAKAYELRLLYENYVPKPMRAAQLYASGSTYRRKCRQPYTSKAYPFHTGWLLADAIYNAGSREVALLQHYFRMTKESHESGSIWKKLVPTDLIDGLHWGGQWNASTNKIEFRNVSGTLFSQSWYKSCVVQRHIARVVQYGTLPGFEVAKSLETEGCSQSVVPEYRKKSSGVKESP